MDTDLTERQKTILEIFKNDGRDGVLQFLQYEGMTAVEAEETYPTLTFLFPNQDTSSPETVTVTFVDGSTQELEVAPDGQVVTQGIMPQDHVPTFMERVFGKR